MHSPSKSCRMILSNVHCAPSNAIQRTVVPHSIRLPMKKTYKLDHPKIKMPRIVDSIKHEIKKTLKKERSNVLPKGTKFWDFDCKLGVTEESAAAVPLSSLTSSLDDLVLNKVSTVYVEMTAKAVVTLDDAAS